MKTRLILTSALIFALVFQVTALGVANTSAAEPTVQNGATGVVTLLSGGTLQNGLFTVTNFAVQNGQIVAIGTLTGTLLNTAGDVVGTVNQTITVPLTNTQASCEILNLTLGPINLDLLGLQVTTNQINVNITAQSGSGNLLGNLLCAVAKLLDSNAAPNAIVNMLNRILGLLG